MIKDLIVKSSLREQKADGMPLGAWEFDAEMDGQKIIAVFMYKPNPSEFKRIMDGNSIKVNLEPGMNQNYYIIK